MSLDTGADIWKDETLEQQRPVEIRFDDVTKGLCSAYEHQL